MDALPFVLWPILLCIFIACLCFLGGKRKSSNIKEDMRIYSSKSKVYKDARLELLLNRVVTPFAYMNMIVIIVVFLTVDVELIQTKYSPDIKVSEQKFYSNKPSSVNAYRSFSYNYHINNYDNRVYYTLRFKNKDGSFYDEAITAKSLSEDDSLIDYGIVKKYHKCWGVVSTIDLSFYNKGVKTFYHSANGIKSSCAVSKVEIVVPKDSLALGITSL